MTHGSTEDTIALWRKRWIITFTVIGWIALGCFFLWVLAQIIVPIFLFLIAILLASMLTPLATLLQRFLPRPLAITLVYVLLLGSCLVLMMFLVNVFVGQLILLIPTAQRILAWETPPTPLQILLGDIGYTQVQWLQLRVQLASFFGNGIQLLSIVRSLVNLFTILLIVITLSIYFVLDGQKIASWLQRDTPQLYRPWVRLLLSLFDRTVNKMVSGLLWLTLAVSILIGVIVTLFGVPFGIFVGVVAFFLQFIPLVGELLISVLCGLLGLVQGGTSAVLLALCVLLLLLLKLVVRTVIAPGQLGRGIGLHPLVALFAMIVGNQFFGLWGTLFALPVASLVQLVLLFSWSSWRVRHPEAFPEPAPAAPAAPPPEPGEEEDA